MCLALMLNVGVDISLFQNGDPRKSYAHGKKAEDVRKGGKKEIKFTIKHNWRC